ncbi:MAG TPA: 4Fe-4S dicluster domain-containing protein, partial [Bacillota bacterium]|nr:4Fe-4S dicluster domain-containing protein [Bacillota bacterium]
VVLVMESYYKRYNLMEWAQTRYNNMPSRASDCEKCGLCEAKCPYQLPIREMLEAVKQTFGQ